MEKHLLIDATHPEETRVALVSGEKLEKFDFETSGKARLRGNIYLAKITRVEPSLQAVFVDYGRDRHGFLSFNEIHHNYFQIPVDDKAELEEHIANAAKAITVPDENDNTETGEESMGDLLAIEKLRQQFYKKYKIQEVIKKRQVILIQIEKDERGNKGAALTTYINLSGRYCILMPNTNRECGISRKITNGEERKRLKKILDSLDVPDGMCVIMRTSGEGRTKAEIKKDFEYLLKEWSEIREKTLKSQAPTLIKEEAGIINRSIRDLYTKDVEEIVVAGDEAYKFCKNLMRSMLSTHSKKVKQHIDKTQSLFSKYSVDDQINGIYDNRVNLPSGGYLIINTTEALISIDVNSGRANKERNIGDTALKTNLEAAAEIAWQCKLRDLGGLIVVDFIDMAERKHNSQIEKEMKAAFKSDKSKVQIGQISQFGLMELSRQRSKNNLMETHRNICPHCQGIGSVWSTESLAIKVLRRLEEVCSSSNVKSVRIILSAQVAMYVLNEKRTFLSSIESAREVNVRVEIDPCMSMSDFKVEPIDMSTGEEQGFEPNEEKSKKQFKNSHVEKKTVEKKSQGATTEESLNVNDKEPLTDSTQQQQKKKSRRRNNRRRNKQNAESSAAGVVPTVEATEDSTKDIAVSSQSEHAVIPKENIKEVIGEVINKDRPKKVEASFLKVLPKLPEDDAETIDKYAKEASKIRQALQDDIGHKFVDDEDKEVIDMIKSSNKSKENWWSKLLK